MMDLLTRAVALPVWGFTLLAAVAIAGWLWGRARVAQERELRQAAERQAGYAVGRAEVHSAAAQALTRAAATPAEGPRTSDTRAFPQPVSPTDVPPRGAGLPDLTVIAADWTVTMPDGSVLPAPTPTTIQAGLAADITAATELRDAVLDSIDDEHTPDLAEAYDVEPEPGDEPPREDGWSLELPDHGGHGEDRDQDAGPPDGGLPVPVSPAPAADAVRRHDWSLAQPVRKGHGVAPDWSRWAWYRRVARWLDGPRTVWGRARRYAGLRWGSEPLDPSPGWRPGEITGEQPEVVAAAPVPTRPKPTIRPLPAHLWRPRMVSVRALLDDWTPAGGGGRHRAGEVSGALGQRQTRLLALPGGPA